MGRIPLYFDDVHLGLDRIKYVNGFSREYAEQYYYHDNGYTVLGMSTEQLDLIFKIYEKSDERFYYPIFVIANLVTDLMALTIPKKVLKKIREKKCKILLHNVFEGWSPSYSYDRYLGILNKKFGILFSDVVILQGNLVKHSIIPSVYFNIWETAYSTIIDNPEYLQTFKKNILDSTPKSHKYICLNGRPKPHRIAVVTLLNEYKDDGILTLGMGDAGVKEFSFDLVYPNFVKYYKRISIEFENLELRKQLPYLYDVDTTIDRPVIDLDSDKFLNSYLHIVTETLFENNTTQTFFSEKIFKPIVFMRPFVLISKVYALKELKKMGFKTFGDIIDESYDSIVNYEDRVIAATNAAIDFFTKPKAELDNILITIIDRLEHNYLLLTKRRNKMIKSLPKELKKCWKHENE